MGPLPTLSIKNQTLTVLENRLQEPGNQVLIKDKTTSNCKQLLLASGATPIGSTAVPPMKKQHRHESSYQPGDMIESTGLVFNRQINAAKVRRTKPSRPGLRSSSTRHSRRRRPGNDTRSRNGRLTSGNRVVLKTLGRRPRARRFQISSSCAGTRSSRSRRSTTK